LAAAEALSVSCKFTSMCIYTNKPLNARPLQQCKCYAG